MNLPGREQWRSHLILAVKVGVLGAALVVVTMITAYITVRKSVSGRDVQVPDLTQMTVEEAAALLNRQGLTIEEAAQRNDEKVEAGRILEQEPAPGSDIKQQRKIKVIVSLGDKVSSIPELRGGAARKAQITLQQQGLRMGDQVYVYSRRVGENLVIAQDPLPENAGLREGKVALLISRGEPPRTYVMPDLTGRSEPEVRSFLGRAGLKSGPVRRDPEAGAPRGAIVEQSPPAGFPVRRGDLVSLTVSGAE